MSKDRESLFDTRSLGKLRSADDRHAIALLDVAIAEIDDITAGPSVKNLISARDNIVRRMVELAKLLNERSDEQDAALGLVKAVRRVV